VKFKNLRVLFLTYAGFGDAFGCGKIYPKQRIAEMNPKLHG